MAFNIATGLHAATIIPNKLASHPLLIALIFFADIFEQTKAEGKRFPISITSLDTHLKTHGCAINTRLRPCCLAV
jgi:hypothetical protein